MRTSMRRTPSDRPGRLPAPRAVLVPRSRLAPLAIALPLVMGLWLTIGLPILAGVTRSVIWKLAAKAEEGRYPLERLLAADEVFLSSSVREVMPVTAVGETVFERGPAAAELQNALRRYAGGA